MARSSSRIKTPQLRDGQNRLKFKLRRFCLCTYFGIAVCRLARQLHQATYRLPILAQNCRSFGPGRRRTSSRTARGTTAQQLPKLTAYDQLDQGDSCSVVWAGSVTGSPLVPHVYCLFMVPGKLSFTAHTISSRHRLVILTQNCRSWRPSKTQYGYY